MKLLRDFTYHYRKKRLEYRRAYAMSLLHDPDFETREWAAKTSNDLYWDLQALEAEHLLNKE